VFGLLAAAGSAGRGSGDIDVASSSSTTTRQRLTRSTEVALGKQGLVERPSLRGERPVRRRSQRPLDSLIYNSAIRAAAVVFFGFCAVQTGATTMG
jgi:hypothetical protein